MVFGYIAALHPTAPHSQLRTVYPAPPAIGVRAESEHIQRRWEEPRRWDSRGRSWPRSRGAPRRPLLGVTEIAGAQEHLLPGFEGRHRPGSTVEGRDCHTGKWRVSVSQIHGQERDPSFPDMAIEARWERPVHM